MDAKNRSRLMVIVSLSQMIQKLASKTTCQGPLCRSTAQGDLRMMTTAIEIELGEVIGVRKEDNRLFKSNIISRCEILIM